MLKDGIYGNLISILVKNELDRVSDKKFIQKSPVDADEATGLLTIYLSEIIERSLESAKNQGKGILGQVEIVNKILSAIGSDEVYRPYIYGEQGKTFEKLLALVNKENVINFTERGYPVERPISPISRSSLFTGSVREPSMYSELKKEALFNIEWVYKQLITIIPVKGLGDPAFLQRGISLYPCIHLT